MQDLLKKYPNVPVMLMWQGEALRLSAITEYDESVSDVYAHGLAGMTRFQFSNAEGQVKLMQFQYPKRPIDWQRLEAENQAPAAIEKKRVGILKSQDPDAIEKRRAMWREQQRKWRAKKGKSKGGTKRGIIAEWNGESVTVTDLMQHLKVSRPTAIRYIDMGLKSDSQLAEIKTGKRAVIKRKAKQEAPKPLPSYASFIDEMVSWVQESE